MRITTSLFLSVSLSVLLGIICLFGLDVMRSLNQPLTQQDGTRYELRSGASMGLMSRELHKQGLLQYARDAHYLVWFGRLSGVANNLQAGEYAVKPGMSPIDLARAMVAGDVIVYSLTIVEGWRLRQVLNGLQRHEQIVASDPPWNAVTLAKELNIDAPTAEGWFYPDTYYFSKGSSDINVLRRAYQAMRKTLEEEWAAREDDLPYQSAYEALIMASIIEKETAVDAERGEIAGVFVRRLRKGMRLQTDPTVIYGMGEQFDGNIRRDDLRRPTPYNTYTQFGLPPTPIAMAGRASIHAALHPLPGDSLYFVSRGDGSHQFSATLEEHNAAVRKYQLGQGDSHKQGGAKTEP